MANRSSSKRKTGFPGFLLCINAVVGLAEDLVNVENPVLKYLLTYKMSQDHLELFLSAVRASGSKRYDLALRPPAADDHSYCDVSNAMELSEYKEAAISYIAGCVVKMVEKKIHCPQCVAALTTNKESIPDLFVTWKTNGGLRLPSLRLLKICKETEKLATTRKKPDDDNMPPAKEVEEEEEQDKGEK
ncbi:Hypothetical predicted protein, partial [Paramuricea clavata]